MLIDCFIKILNFNYWKTLLENIPKNVFFFQIRHILADFAADEEIIEDLQLGCSMEGRPIPLMKVRYQMFLSGRILFQNYIEV